MHACARFFFSLVYRSVNSTLSTPNDGDVAQQTSVNKATAANKNAESEAAESVLPVRGDEPATVASSEGDAAAEKASESKNDPGVSEEPTSPLA